MSLSLRNIAVAASVFIAPFALSACGGATADSEASADAKTEKPAPAKATDKGQARDNDMVIGDKDAPVTVIEYASVTCGGCAVAHATILPELKTQYIEKGLVKLVFREYPKAPASLVNQSFLGSVLARCAGEKSGDEAYFAVIDALLKTQRGWIGGDTEAELKKIAAQAGLNNEDFDQCLTRQDIVDLINDNIVEAENDYQITGTPSFVINGELTRIGSFDSLKKAVDPLLGDKAPKAEPEETASEESAEEPAPASDN